MTPPTRDELVHTAAQEGKDHQSRRLLFLLGLVTLLSLIAVVIGGYLLWNEKQRQALAGKDLAIQVQQACTDPERQLQLGSLCAKAEKVEQQIKEGPQGPPGIQGPQGPPGVDGRDGVDGQTGLPGTNGKNGLNGKDGDTGPMGPAGPPGADGKDGVDGKNGTDGKDGTNGTDGRGISSVQCDGTPTTKFTIFYTDGTQQQVECTTP